jgi:hypothetical protein
MEALLPWILASVVLVALAAMLLAWRLPRQRAQQPKPLPSEWALAPRPVFSTDERRVYRQLREALPHHIVLSKLPLVRFCQPSDPNEVRYWYELLGSIHVTFAICSANGRVLAAIDLDTDRGNSRRITQIKQSVLGACRVPRALPALPGGQPAVDRRTAVARAAGCCGLPWATARPEPAAAAR